MDIYNYCYSWYSQYFFDRLMMLLHDMSYSYLDDKSIYIGKIRRLLSYKFDLNKMNEYGYTPLTYVVSRNSVLLNEEERNIVIKLLLEAQIDVNLYKHQSAFEFALDNPRNISTIKILLENGAEIKNVVSSKLAKDFNSWKLIDLFVEYGWSIELQDHFEGTTLLWYALSHNNEELFDKLLEKGADVNSRNYSGQTILMHFCDRFSTSKNNMISVLINHGANLNYVNPQNSMSTLMFWIQAQNPSLDLLIVEFLGKNIFENFHQKDGNRNNALVYAIKYSNNIDLLRLLVEHYNIESFSTSICDNLCKRLSKNSNESLCKIIMEYALILLSKGLDIKVCLKDVLMEFIKNSRNDIYYPIVEILLKDSSILTNLQLYLEPYTYLTAAIRKDHENFRIIKVLLNHYADPSIIFFKKSKTSTSIRKKSFMAYLDLGLRDHQKIWNIIQNIIITRNCSKILIESMPFISNEFTSRPNSFRYKIMALKWDLRRKTIGEVYEEMLKEKNVLLDYLGIHNLETFKWKITEYVENIE